MEAPNKVPCYDGGSPMSTAPAVARRAGVPLPGSGRFSSLDGLRAISILLVLVGHLSGTRHFLTLELGIGDYAHLGVVVFFVISGFLITSLLLDEHAKYGRVSLKLFYARRALRIFPASYVFILCICLLWAAGVVHLQARDVWHALTYTVNYQTDRSWGFGHLWSLSVEEQFYLLWPFAFVALRPRRAIWAAAAVILVGPMARIFSRFFLFGTPYQDLEMFPMVADSLAAGCLLARVRPWLETRRWYLRLFHPASSLALLALLLVLNRLVVYTVVSVFGGFLINLIIAFLTHRSVYCAGGPMGRVLNWKPVAFIGVLSYSLYLWQQLFLNRASDAWVNAFPQNLVLAFGAALASYLLLEKPLMRLRHRLRV
jgi:peptidoglycan/LPS O-acetylase OafA/YrhL